MKRILLLFMVVGLGWGAPFDAIAQITFNKDWGGKYGDHFYGFQQTSDEGYIITGNTYDTLDFYGKILLLKLNKFGSEEWHKTFKGATDNNGRCVEIVGDSGYVLVGPFGYYSGGKKSIDLIRTDKLGDTLWIKSFEVDTGLNLAYQVQVAEDGGFLIAGNLQVSEHKSALLIKTDANGNKQWINKYGGEGVISFRSLEKTFDGGYIAAGRTWDSILYQDSIYLLKIDLNGNTQWTKEFKLGADCFGESIKPIPTGGFILAGIIALSQPVPYTDNYDVFLSRLDENGEILWTEVYDEGLEEFATGVVVTSDGGFAYTGHGDFYGDPEIFIAKTNENGLKEWTKSDFREGIEEVSAEIIQTRDGGYAICGHTTSLAGYYDLAWQGYILKTDGQGNVNGVPSGKSDEDWALNIYPNPSSISNIQLSISNSLIGSNVEVYDANGRLVFYSAISTPNSAFELQVQKGVYFIHIHNERASVVKRWVKL